MMCRKPMSHSRNEMDRYETARAEEDVANFVRQFENCDVCNTPGNPNMKYPGCSWFICDGCIPCHDKLKPSHVLEAIISSDRKGNPTIRELKLCSKHHGQIADLFCIMCLKTMCVHCRDYSHADCERMFHEAHVQERCGWGFLQSYRQYDRASGNLLKVYYITEISEAAHTWLIEIQKELKACIVILKNNKETLGMLNRQFFCSDTDRLESIQAQIDSCVALGVGIYHRTQGVLKMSIDIDTVIFLLHAEEEYLFFWGIEMTLAANTCLINVGPYNGLDNHLFSYAAKCSVQFASKTLPGALCFRHKFCQSLPSNESRWSKINGQTKLLPSYGEIFERNLPENLNDIVTVSFVLISGGLRSTGRVQKQGYMSEMASYFSTSFRNVTKEYFDHLQVIFWKHYGDIMIHTMYEPYFCSLPSTLQISILSAKRSAQGIKRIIFSIMDDAALTACFATRFVNVIFLQNLIKYVGKNEQGYNAYILAFTGNRSEESGLETVIMYYDRQSNGNPVVYGVCINTPLAKFHSKTTEILDKSRSQRLLVKGTKGVYYLMHDLQDNYCTSSYQTERAEPQLADDVLTFIDRKESHTTEHIVPMKHLIVDLLCSFNEEIFFTVIQDTMIKVGKMSFDSNGMKTQLIGLVTELEIGISIQNLKPLTMVKSTNDIIVVCSVRDDTKKFVLIRQRDTPRHKHVITLLNMCYESSEILEVDEKALLDIGLIGHRFKEDQNAFSEATVAQFDITPEGDILYVLENKFGQSLACRTKYLI